MTFLALVFLLAATVAIWVLPRAWAPVPLLAGACYMTLGQGIEVAGLNFPIIRLLLLAGVVRVLVRGERPAGGCWAWTNCSWPGVLGLWLPAPPTNPRAQLSNSIWGWSMTPFASTF